MRALVNCPGPGMFVLATIMVHLVAYKLAMLDDVCAILGGSRRIDLREEKCLHRFNNPSPTAYDKPSAGELAQPDRDDTSTWTQFLRRGNWLKIRD